MSLWVVFALANAAYLLLMVPIELRRREFDRAAERFLRVVRGIDESARAKGLVICELEARQRWFRVRARACWVSADGDYIAAELVREERAA